MILSLIKYFNGGLTYEYLENITIDELIKKHENAVKISEIEKREAGK